MAGFGSLFVYTFSVFVKPLGASFGWGRESISLGFGLAAITLGISSPLIGRMLDRFGPRRVIVEQPMLRVRDWRTTRTRTQSQPLAVAQIVGNTTASEPAVGD